jgi:TP901 family phage tail tape measure protein
MAMRPFNYTSTCDGGAFVADRSVKVVVSAQVQGFVAGMRTAQGSVVDFSKRAEAGFLRNQQHIDTLSSSAARLGVGLTALAGFAVKSAMDWESAWAGVTKTIDGTPEQLAKIEQGLQDMSAVKPVTAIELAEIAESAGALGVKTEDILSFTSVMADLGQTTNLSSDEAATSIAQLMNVMQTAPEDVDNLGAALVDLGNKGASTERQIVQMAQNIAGAGAIVGLSEANVLALGNALASSGIEAEAGGSAISNVLMDIDMSVKSGNESIQMWADVAGMSAKDFADAWRSDPADALASFVEGLGRMNERGEDVFSTLDSLGQSDIRVSRALLNMAASGDMLRESLANGDAAWERNTALAIEAAKRYETTASQAKRAWNEIKAEAVSAGQGLLPVVANIADKVGDLAGVFGKLPDEAQSGITAISAVGGAGLLAFAGISKLAGGLAASHVAMAELQKSSPRAATALGAVSKAARVAYIAVGAYYAINKTQGGGDQIAGTAKITKYFLDLADGSDKAKESLRGLATIKADQDILHRLGFGGSSFADIDGIKDLFDSASRNTIQSIGNKITPYDDSYDTAQKGIKAIDAALTQMVTSGAVEQAAAGFKFLGEESGKSVEELEEKLPSYAEAVQGLANDQDIAAKSAGRLGGAVDGVAAPTAEAAEALQKARDAAAETGEAFVNLGDDLDNPKVSLGDWLKQLEDQATALRDFTKNAKTAAKEGLEDGLIQSLQEAGPAGAQRMAELANATDTEIRRANRAWRKGQDAIADYVDSVAGVPPSKATDIKTPGLGAATTAVNALKTALDNINPYKKITIDTIKRSFTEDQGGNSPGVDAAFGGPKKGKLHAAGGAVTGIGTATSDSIPAWLSNGEHVLTAAEVEKLGGQAAVYRMRSAIWSGDMPAFADGGAVSKLDIANQERTVRDLERSLREREEYGKKRKGHKRPTRLVLKLGSIDRRIAEMELGEARIELADLKSGKAARDEAAQKRADDAEQAAVNRRDAATGTRDSVASGLRGGFGLAQFVQKNEYGFYNGLSGAGIAAGAVAFAGKVRAFASKLERARKLGIPTTMLQEVAGLGIEEGGLALDALLSASSSDIATIRDAYRDIDIYAKGAGEVIAKALDLTNAGQDSAAGYAAGFIEGLNSYADQIGAAITNAAQGKKTDPLMALARKTKKLVAPGSATAYGVGVSGTPSTGLDKGNGWGAAPQTYTSASFAGGATTTQFSLVGVEVAIGADGIGRIVDGHIAAAQQNADLSGAMFIRGVG